MSIKVVHELGEGSFGTVLLVERGEARAKYAMKVYKSGELLDKNEINILNALRHAHTVQYRGLIVFERKDAVLMEYCDGGDLAKYFENCNEPLMENLVWEWFTQLSAAMAYFHARGIIHRDMKPANVLLANGELKISDFGLASIMDLKVSKATTSNKRGTPLYMAPELFDEVAHFGPKSDIWGLGCIVYEMCTLKYAFRAVMAIISKECEPIQGNYSSTLKNTVARMLRKLTEERIDMEEILNLRHIRDYMTDAVAPSRPSTSNSRLASASRGKEKSNEKNNETRAPRMETVRARKPRLTNEEVLQFKYEDFSPVEANQNGEYPSIRWQDERWLARWREIVGNKLDKFPFPPLLLNEDIIDNVVIVIDGWRNGNEFMVSGSFHSKVPKNVSGLNVQMKLSLTFTNIDNTILTVDKQIIATVEHKYHSNDLFKLYDVPFAYLSSSISPVANISIRRISPGEESRWASRVSFTHVRHILMNILLVEQKWFYFGLPPLIGRHGKFDTIDCNSLHGTVDCAREWKKMVEIRYGYYLSLPPLRLASENVDDATVCVFGWRNGNELQFHAKFHWSTPENVKSREILFKIDFHVTTRDSSNLQRKAENRVTLKRDWSFNIISIELPWETVSADKFPRVRLSILPANYNTSS